MSGLIRAQCIQPTRVQDMHVAQVALLPAEPAVHQLWGVKSGG